MIKIIVELNISLFALVNRTLIDLTVWCSCDWSKLKIN